MLYLSMAARFSFQGWYKGWFFRSFKELSFVLLTEKNGSVWRTAEVNELAVYYTDPWGRTKKHYADILVDESTMFEIKPKKHQRGKIVKLKAEAMKKFCETKGYTYQMVSPRKISKEELETLLEEKKIVLTDSCKDKVKTYLTRRK